MKFKVVVTCAQGHEQTITVDYDTPEQAWNFAGLLDGSHPLYRGNRADASASVIWKCGQCGAAFSADVQQV